MLKKILNFFKRPLPKKEKLKIWGVIEGPYSKQEVGDPYVPDELNYMLLCKVSHKGKVFNQEFWFGTFAESRVIVDHFKVSIEPMEMSI